MSDESKSSSQSQESKLNNHDDLRALAQRALFSSNPDDRHKLASFVAKDPTRLTAVLDENEKLRTENKELKSAIDNKWNRAIDALINLDTSIEQRKQND